MITDYQGGFTGPIREPGAVPPDGERDAARTRTSRARRAPRDRPRRPSARARADLGPDERAVRSGTSSAFERREARADARASTHRSCPGVRSSHVTSTFSRAARVAALADPARRPARTRRPHVRGRSARTARRSSRPSRPPQGRDRRRCHGGHDAELSHDADLIYAEAQVHAERRQIYSPNATWAVVKAAPRAPDLRLPRARLRLPEPVQVDPHPERPGRDGAEHRPGPGRLEQEVLRRVDRQPRDPARPRTRS